MADLEPRAYFVSLSAIADLRRFEQYREVLSKLRTIFEGRDLVRFRPVHTVIGTPTDARLTVVEHPTMEQLQSLRANPEYEALVEALRSSAGIQSWVASGVLPSPPPLLGPPGRRAYVVTRSYVQSPERLDMFIELVSRLIALRGGRYLVRFAETEPILAPSDGCALSVLEFPSMPLLQAGLDSDDFRDMMKLGVGISYKGFWIAEGELDAA